MLSNVVCVLAQELRVISQSAEASHCFFDYRQPPIE